MTDALVKQLRRHAARYETASFTDGDPSKFFHALRGGKKNSANVEATAFVASCLSFGSIPQFIPKIELLVRLAGGDIDRWIRDGLFENSIVNDGKSFYRYVTNANLFAFLSTYRGIMHEHGTLGGYVERECDGTCLGAVKAICKAFSGSGAGYLVPAGASSACKRLCMFLRWAVRTGSPVDMGFWSGFIDRATLVIPLDTHVVQEAQSLGLLPPGASATMATALKLTAQMAKVFPGDPARGDFALYGHHLENSSRRRGLP